MSSRQLKTCALERIAILSAGFPNKNQGRDNLVELYKTSQGGSGLHEQSSRGQVNGCRGDPAKLSQTPMVSGPENAYRKLTTLEIG